MFYDIEKAYKNGISYLHMGGEFQDNCFYREKDILEDDYSTPTLIGKFEIEYIKDCTISSESKLFLVVFAKNEGKLFLTDEELNAGLIESEGR